MEIIRFFMFFLSVGVVTTISAQQESHKQLARYHSPLNTLGQLLDISDTSPTTKAPLPADLGSISSEEFEHIKCLEIKRKALTIITSKTTLKDYNSSDAMLLHWLTGILLTAPSETYAIFCWHNLAALKNRTINDFSPEHHDVFKLPAEKIAELYQDIQTYVHNCEPLITQEIITRMYGKWGSIELDYNEMFRYPIRSLDNLKNKGLTFTILDEHIATLVQAFTKNPETVLINNFKNLRLLTVNGLTDSKIAFMIHDLFDHWWLTEKLERMGTMKRYGSFFKAVGNPHKADLFSREGELISSIGFEFRLFLASHDYKPLFSVHDIKNILNESEHKGTLSENQKRAYQLINNTHNKTFDEGLPFIFSGVIIELMEQRRKNGCIKILDENNQLSGVLEALDPEYTALIVEASCYLCEPLCETLDALLSIMLLSEQFVEDIARGSKKQITVFFEDIESYNEQTSRLSPHKLAWLKNNLGSSATRKILPDQLDVPA